MTSPDVVVGFIMDIAKTLLGNSIYNPIPNLKKKVTMENTTINNIIQNTNETVNNITQTNKLEIPEPIENFIQPNNSSSEVEVSLKGLHPSLPDLTVSGKDSTTVIIITISIVVIILCILGYLYGVKKAKMKPRNLINVNPEIHISPNITSESFRSLLEKDNGEMKDATQESE